MTCAHPSRCTWWPSWKGWRIMPRESGIRSLSFPSMPEARPKIETMLADHHPSLPLSQTGYDRERHLLWEASGPALDLVAGPLSVCRHGFIYGPLSWIFSLMALQTDGFLPPKDSSCCKVDVFGAFCECLSLPSPSPSSVTPSLKEQCVDGATPNR
ncbi:hypothetical protein N657DRAFT_404350 [Parathielavia appendiculata]|uniref:Uncharacterized protein n=1 Tax=Parathielavia appendiculata TaxID=2587402 RepID=A0AAN6TQF9_9PEZI|nr:hypothetical protein N657DRAFT_404350 [Parathielavia appendiculata]